MLMSLIVRVKPVDLIFIILYYRFVETLFLYHENFILFIKNRLLESQLRDGLIELMNCFVVVYFIKVVFELKHLQWPDLFVCLFVSCSCWIGWTVGWHLVRRWRCSICSCLLLVSCWRLLGLCRRCTHCYTILALLELPLKFILFHICSFNLLPDHL